MGNLQGSKRGTPLSESERRTGLWRQSVAAMVQHLSRFTVALYDINEKKIASGSAFRIFGRYFIATAGHVLCKSNIANIYIFRPFDPNGFEELTATRLSKLVPTAVLGWGHRVEKSDVGWLELEESVARSLGCEFLDPQDIECRTDDVVDDRMPVLGTPATGVVEHEYKRGFLVVAPLYYDAVSLLDRGQVNGYDQAVDLMLEYPKSDVVDSFGRPLSLPVAHGLSGAGIWALHCNADGIWEPRAAKLIAIQSSWKEFKYLRTVRIVQWLRMLADDCPEMSSYLAHLYLK